MDEELKKVIAGVEARLAGLDRATADLATELRKLRSRVTVLERPSNEPLGAPVDLDAVDADIAPLVTALRKAWDAEQPIFTDEALSVLRSQAEEYEGLLNERASLSTADSGRRFGRGGDRADIELRQRRLDWHIATKEADYAEVAQKLEAHDQTVQNPEHKQLMGIAEEARSKLPAAARKRIEQALVAGDRMPVWFTVALGQPRSPNPDQWMSTAVGLLAYRLEYGITDQVAALGSRPSGSADLVPWARRIAAFDGLLAKLTELYA